MSGHIKGVRKWRPLTHWGWLCAMGLLGIRLCARDRGGAKGRMSLNDWWITKWLGKKSQIHNSNVIRYSHTLKTIRDTRGEIGWRDSSLSTARSHGDQVYTMAGWRGWPAQRPPPTRWNCELTSFSHQGNAHQSNWAAEMVGRSCWGGRGRGDDMRQCGWVGGYK